MLYVAVFVEADLPEIIGRTDRNGLSCSALVPLSHRHRHTGKRTGNRVVPELIRFTVTGKEENTPSAHVQDLSASVGFVLHVFPFFFNRLIGGIND